MNIPRVWGAEMKDSNPNHPKTIFRVYYPPHLLPKIFGCIAFKSLGTPSYLIKFNFTYNCTVLQKLKFPRVWGAEMKNSDPNHPKVLSWVNYPPHRLAKVIDSIAFKSIGTP